MKPTIVEYLSDYGNKDLRGQDITARPKLAPDLAKVHGGPKKSLLDIGCGNMYKTLALHNDFETIIGLDPSPDLIAQAKQTIENKKISNASIVEGVAQSLPDFSIAFNVVTAMLTIWRPDQVHRVIKDDGLFLIECLGPEDKTTFTKHFGKDDQGWRGANVGKSLADMESEIKDKLSPYFDISVIHNQSWQTQYSKKGLWSLLCNTYSTVRHFDPIQDKDIFEQTWATLEKESSVVLMQNRLVIEARTIR